MAPSTTSTRPEDVIRRIGDTNERALTYVLDPDPQLVRMSRKVREAIIPDLPPVTAGALLGPAALARHFVASAAAGRYRDLFALWELFRQRPDECRPILAEHQRALEKARAALTTAIRLGLSGHAERVAQDVAQAQGLIWTWVRETLVAELPAVGQRPAIASALLEREPDLEIPLPRQPDERWLAEAAGALRTGSLVPSVDALLAAHADHLPATVPTLQLAYDRYPDRLPALVDRVDLDSPSIGALMAWTRDHGLGDRLRTRIRTSVAGTAEQDRAAGLATWYSWRERGVQVDLPDALRVHTLDGLDVSRPETAALAKLLIDEGAPFDMQEVVAELGTRNRQLAEKAYEAFVCAGLDVSLPASLENNPWVKEGTRCPYCQSWTYVRAGHERRCPRRPPDAPAEEPTEMPPAEEPTASGEPTPDPAPREPGEGEELDDPGDASLGFEPEVPATAVPEDPTQAPGEGGAQGQEGERTESPPDDAGDAGR